MNFLTDCSEVMNNYLSLDKGERVPLGVTLHLITCKECRNQVRALKKAEKIARAPLEIPVAMDDFSIEAVMAKIAPNYNSTKSDFYCKMDCWRNRNDSFYADIRIE